MLGHKMISSLELLTLIKQTAGDCSDYRVAQLLNVQKATVSKWARGVGGMSEGIAREAARYVGLPEEWVVACIHAEKHEGTEIYEVWKKICRTIAPKRKAA